MAVSPDGLLYIADTGNGRIRRVDSSGKISTFALDGSISLVFDSAGNLYLSTTRITPDSGVATDFAASSGTKGFAGDGGPALDALVNFIGAIAIDSEGNIFFFDENNRRIRAVRFGAVLSPPDALVASAGGSPQSAPIRAAFSSPLSVTVQTSDGHAAPGTRVDFSSPSSGATCVFDNGSSSISVLTDQSGKASAVCLANCFAGSYAVTATPLASGKSVSFSLKNLAGSAPHGARERETRGEEPGPCGIVTPLPAPIPVPVKGRL